MREALCRDSELVGSRAASGTVGRRLNKAIECCHQGRLARLQVVGKRCLRSIHQWQLLLGRA